MPNAKRLVALYVCKIILLQGLSFIFTTTTTPATSYAKQSNTIPPLGILSYILARRGQLLAVVVDGGVDANKFADDWASDAAVVYPGFNGSSFGDGQGFDLPELRALYIPPMSTVVKPFESAADLRAYINAEGYSGPGAPSIYAAIEFQSGPPSYRYRIPMNATELVDTSTSPVNTFVSGYFPEAIYPYLFGMTLQPAPGFLSLQLAVDRFILSRREVPASFLDPNAAMSVLGSQLWTASPAASIIRA